jgi:glutamate synthase domain-containing protein 3
MTGGTVVILGPVGYNVGAGMTGGACYVWDPHARLTGRLNTSLVDAVRPDADHLQELRWMIELHVELTGSTHAQRILDDWVVTALQTWYVGPVDRVARIETQQAGRIGANA